MIWRNGVIVEASFHQGFVKKFWQERLIRSSHIQRYQSFSERVSLWMKLLESLPSEQPSCSTRSHEITGTFSNDDENVNVTDRKSGKRTLMLPRMPNLARLVVHIHSRPQSSSLLRMTDGKKSSGEPWTKLFRYLLLVETKKARLIGQSATR